ncbi:MAG TPA: hypothetical protein VGF09_01615 [Solirubrobacterales bacterium]|jgi:hypothetical protein
MRWAPSIAALVACALLLPAAAAALEGPRAEYREKVEPICRANTEANDHILRGVRSNVRKGKLKPAGRQLVKASTAFHGAVAELRKVPRPAADEKRLTEWLGQLANQATLLRSAGKALIAGNRHRAGSLVTQLSNGARKANALVVSFEFRDCRLDASRYT